MWSPSHCPTTYIPKRFPVSPLIDTCTCTCICTYCTVSYKILDVMVDAIHFTFEPHNYMYLYLLCKFNYLSCTCTYVHVWLYIHIYICTWIHTFTSMPCLCTHMIVHSLHYSSPFMLRSQSNCNGVCITLLGCTKDTMHGH